MDVRRQPQDGSLPARRERVLGIDGLTVAYHAGPPVLHDISLDLHPGEILAVLGRNGAGKTTLLRAISGLLRPRTGTVELHGKSLAHTPTYKIAQLGIAHVPEGRRVISNMTVIDNLRLGAYGARGAEDVASRLAHIYQILPTLEAWAGRRAGTLSGGEQQILSIARALMANPEVVLLDEPLTGLSPAARRQVLNLLQGIKAAGRALMIVEQNVAETLGAVDRGLVFDRGGISLEGTPEQLLEDESFKAKYLGVNV